MMEKIIQFLSCDTLWSALSALGTIAASVVALWLAPRDHTKHMTGLLVWDRIEYYEPILMLFNTGNIPIAIKTIQLSYKGREFFRSNALEDYKSDSYGKYIIESNSSQKIRLDKDAIKITGVKHPNRNLKIFAPVVTIRIWDVTGKKFTFRQKMTEAKMGEVIFGAALFDGKKN